MSFFANDCAENPCALGATCHDLVNDFECTCPNGFSGKRCHIKDNLCEPNPCINGKCVDTLFDRLCICKAGWIGQFCDVNIDDCEVQPCKNGATCRDMENGYECQCTPGFHGSECQHMVDHCATDPCHNNGTCINQGAKYECQCRLGFEGVHCEHNINECEVGDNGCDAHGTELCEDLVNGFRCQCRPGYTGKACDIHIDQCGGEPCHNNGTCVDLGASYRCECGPGWMGDLCEKQSGKCGQTPCQNDGHCVSLAHDDYFCVCPEGVSGKNCEVAPNRCIGEPCHNGGVCGDFGSHLECTCAKGFVGAGCQYELDACHASKCENGAKCVQEGSGYKCMCPPGFTGQNCETNIDDCTPSPCPLSATCIDQINDYHCQCPFNMTGANCDKKVDPDYDIHFFDNILPAQAALAVPFKFNSGALTVSFWVKFDNELSKGTVFTLYNSATPSYPYNVTQLLQVTDDIVKLSLFADEPAFKLHFPNKQRLNDGNWNNLVLTWTSHEGAYSLIWNAVRLYADKGYGKNKQLDINAWVSLGHPLDAPDEDPKFIGSLTRVNIWTRVLDFENDIPQLVQKCHGQQVIFNGLALRYAGYDRLSGKVEKIVKSTCGRDKMLDSKSAKKRDENSVSAISCPGDVYVITPLKEVNVTWEEPVFVSNNAIERIEQNLKPGQVFTWGEFTVLYVAYDNSSNIAQCTFKVHVAQEFCPDVADPIHGVQACENWGPDLKFRACSIQCEEGYEFSSSPAVFYTCSADGVWKPRADNSYTFRYPSCSKATPADRIAQMKINYPAVSICNAASKNTLAEKLLLKVHQLNSKWNICSSKSDTHCQRVNITVDCLSDMKRLRRQNNGAQQTFNVHVEIPIKRQMVTDPKTSQKTDIIDVIQDEALLHDLFNLEQVLPNGRPDLNSFQVKDRFDCEPGSVVVNDMCVLCAPGSFYDKDTAECVLCGTGEYQNKAGQFSCSKCPEETITTGPGALDETECQTHCKAGYFLNLHTRKCEACGFGFYQPASGSFACIPCGVGKTTLSNTAASEDDCRDECPDGEHLTQSGTCQPCPMGSYRTKGLHKQCVECPPGTTTETVRSSKRVQCNTPKCVAGQFLVTSTKQCQYCPRGTYQDEPLQTTCKLCATDHTTAAQGATHESQCYSTNQCSTGEDNCSWNAVCIDFPDDNDVPSFQCKCKPGYRGNGTVCTDACQNFCLNDGKCKKNSIGYVECVCKEQFSGERCEIRVKSRSSEITFYIVIVVAGILIFIVIFIVIWMINARSQRDDFSINETEKPSLGLEGALTSNFLYGRGPVAVERPPSSLAGGSHGPIRPIGFYYEDDDEYEAKTMFVGAEVQPEEQDHDENSDLQREIQERLRHVHQHMYRPSGNSTKDD
uniref:Sushi, von Willebrand factor type A, EGF and pentraxin domain-containing protein 1 n=1 Tax=Panagrolaimus superbus TaxID=310955 RepID=A0A914YVY8_9BILA